MSPDVGRSFEQFLHPEPVLVVITGPSGVGKDSVIDRMRERGYPFHFVVTATDRGIREGEINGVDYIFVATEEFERMIEEDELFEHAWVYDQYKGVPKAQVRAALAAGKDVAMRVDIQGARTISEKVPGAVTVFLAPPSPESLARRLRRRSTDSDEQIEKRLQMAVEEMQAATEFDYVVVNWDGQLDRAVHQIMVIIEAAKLRTDRQSIEL